MEKMLKDLNFSKLSTVQPGVHEIVILNKKMKFKVLDLGIVGTSGPRDIMNKLDLYRFLSIVINLIVETGVRTTLLLRDGTIQSKELFELLEGLIALTGATEHIVKVKYPTTTVEAVNCVASYTKEHDIDAIALILTASHSDPDKFIGFKMVVSLKSLSILLKSLTEDLPLPKAKMYGFLTRSAATYLEDNTNFIMTSPTELKNFKRTTLPENYAHEAMIKTIKQDMEYLGITEELLKNAIDSVPHVIYVNPMVAKTYEHFGFNIEKVDRPWTMTSVKENEDKEQRKTDTDGDRYGAVDENPEILFSQTLYAAILISQRDLPIIISQERYTMYILRAVEEARKETGFKLPIIVTSQGEASNLVGFYELALSGYEEAYTMDWAIGIATQNNQILMKRPVISAILDIIFNYKRFYVDFSDIDREEQVISAENLNLTERNSILTAAGKKIKKKLKSKGNFEFIKMDGLLITGDVNGEKVIISSRTSGTERIIKIIGYATDVVLISEIIEIIVKAINIT